MFGQKNLSWYNAYHQMKPTSAARQKKKKTKPLTSMLQKDSNTSLFSFGSREVEQCPAVGIADLRWVSLLQHSPNSADIPRCHCCLDLQLFMKLRVPSAVMVQHPVTFRNGNVYLYLTLIRKNQWIHSVCLGELGGYMQCVWLTCQGSVTWCLCYENVLPSRNVWKCSTIQNNI